MKTITVTKEINIDVNLDIDEVYESLNSYEKEELFQQIYDEGDIGVSTIINMLSSFDDQEMRAHYLNDRNENYDDIKTLFDEGSFNDNLVSLVDKKHMLTKQEIEVIGAIAKKYQYFK